MEISCYGDLKVGQNFWARHFYNPARPLYNPLRNEKSHRDELKIICKHWAAARTKASHNWCNFFFIPEVPRRITVLLFGKFVRPRQMMTLVTAVPLSLSSRMLDSSRGVLIVCAEKVDILWNNLQRRGESGASSRDLFARLPQLPRGELRSSFRRARCNNLSEWESTHTLAQLLNSVILAQTGTKSHVCVCVPSWMCASSLALPLCI